MNIPQYVQFTLNRLEQNGYNAYLVGGCVRDYLMSRTPNDFDVTTNALPKQIKECFGDVKTLDIGEKHGTVTVVLDEGTVEVTTFRIDGNYCDNRHPESVEFTDKIALDLKRRDFTVNAIAYSKSLGFADPFSGQQDIKDKIIRCVGDADVRFNEDGLRIIRGLRFASTLGFCIEKETGKSILKNKNLLCSISKERINTELVKLVCGTDAGRILDEYKEVIFTVLPEMSFVDEKIYGNMCRKIDLSENDTLKRLCLFFSVLCDEKTTLEAMKKMTFTNKAALCVSKVSGCMGKNMPFDKIGIKYAIKLYGYETSKLVYQTKAILNDDALVKCNEALDYISYLENSNACLKVNQLEIGGCDIMDAFGVEGKKVGQLLDFLLCLVIEEKCSNDRASLLDACKKQMNGEK